ncbi:hypothetical protein H5410_008590 [Solanum commersonii]|uniref:Uncharacterized protein n=1 Tax=Solanum commersonii TaxID=4109 RepID=A0A9J6AGF4_SOLCO|nr:hypothetical protein H5410_008590 [Solanum commersonii]
MKDYAVEESWIQLYTIRETFFILNRPLHMFDNGEVLLSCRRMNYVGYRFRTSKGPFGLWLEFNTILHGITYTESMISSKLLN